MIKDKDSADNTKIQLGSFEEPLTITTNKLDADQYSASDLDGSTDSVFGSGNMAYASLQASQTDAALNANASNASKNTDANITDVSNSSNGSIDQNYFGDGDDASQGASARRDDFGVNTDREMTSGNNEGSPISSSGNGGFVSSTVGSVGASELSSNAGAFAPSGSGLSLSDGLDGAGAENLSSSTDLAPESRSIL